MIRERTLRARDKLVGKLPATGELLRGSLLERTVRHTKGCPKCARGEGHRVFVLTVTYAGGCTTPLSVPCGRGAGGRALPRQCRELEPASAARRSGHRRVGPAWRARGRAGRW